MKKKFFISILLLSTVFIFTSCVDMEQVVDYYKGKYEFSLRILLSKPLMTLADMDIDDLYDSVNPDDLPEEINAKIIDTDNEAGFSMSFYADPKEDNNSLEVFVPKKLKDGSISIPILMGEQLADTSTEDFLSGEYAFVGQAMFSSAKCRFFLSNKIASDFTSAFVRNKTTSSSEFVEFYKVGNMYCFEIPFIELMNGKTELIIK